MIAVPGWSEENNRRASDAQEALGLYLDTGHNSAAAVCTLLSDLRHYCDAHRLSFTELNSVASRNYAGQVLELI